MKKKNIISLFQRSDLIRFLTIPFLFLILTAGIGGITLLGHSKPHIETISPNIGEPGDILVIKGSNFGKEQNDNWVEINGSRITESSYRKWEDTVILVELPQNIRDGLVYIHTKTSKSKPVMFANKKNIPVAAQIKTDQGMPFIESFDSDTGETGKKLIIRGKNFGLNRSGSQVLFAWQIDSGIPVATTSRTAQLSISGSEHDFDYEFWSDQELRVRVPDGAVSGNVYVLTERGLSNTRPLRLVNQSGTKNYPNKRTYILSMQVDISRIEASGENTLFIRIPLPVLTPSQRDVQLTASSPQPYIENYQNTILHQLDNLKTGKDIKIAHSIAISVSDVITTINPVQVKPYKETNSPLYIQYTSPDNVVPSANPKIKETAMEIVKKEKNPWRKAKLIYDWILENIKPMPGKNPDRSIETALTEKTGDAYDMALLFTALARAAEIPAVPVAGILVNNKRQAQNHWWAEFWIEGTGWVPVDPGLGAGYPIEMRSDDRKNWYFGNCDSSHIAFSRGWSDHKQMTPNSKVVYKPRSFAFQPIWEESSAQIKSYASFWGTPGVTGVY
ncbi:MAG TPA: transglutaminase domain-containing protein [Treponemataceae bacterium]|nr:transglutaminase domain-containing protein [Treponemataceae bacterium]